MLITGLCLWMALLRGPSLHNEWPTVHAQKNAMTTVADITGSGAKVQLATSGTARWIQLTTLAANSAVVRVGDSNVSASQGMAIAAGSGQFLPPLPISSSGDPAAALYQLSTIYLYIGNSDVGTVTAGN